MVNHYKILQKARMTGELFAPDLDEAAHQQDLADREWALELEPDREAAETPLLEAAAQPQVELEPAVPALLAPAQGGLTVLPARRRSWAEMLADTTGNRALEGMRTLGVCALDRRRGATGMTAALARWAAQNSDSEVLVVEAHTAEPRLALEFGAHSAGLVETLGRSDAADALVQDTELWNLKALTGGAALSARDRRRVIDELPMLLASLKGRFRSVILELPAVNDPAFRKMPIGALADAVILVADSRTARPRDLRRAAESVRLTKTPLAGTILESVQQVMARAGARFAQSGL